MGAMVNAPFRKWHHKSKVVTPHVSKPAHIATFQAAEDYIQSIEFLEKTIPVIMNIIKAKNIAENKCGRRCITLREDNEELDSAGNPGNCLALMRLLSNHDPMLKQHLDYTQVAECHLPVTSDSK